MLRRHNSFNSSIRFTPSNKKVDGEGCELSYHRVGCIFEDQIRDYRAHNEQLLSDLIDVVMSQVADQDGQYWYMLYVFSSTPLPHDITDNTTDSLNMQIPL